MNKNFKRFMVIAAIMAFLCPKPAFAMEDETFYLYVHVLDENGKAYTNYAYEPGLMVEGQTASHGKMNKFGVATVDTTKSESNTYNYFVYNDDGNYNSGAQVLTIEENYSFLKVELATKSSGGTSKLTLFEPGDADYPENPINPENGKVNKVTLSGRVTDKNGGVAGVTVSVNNPSRLPQKDYTETTTTDSNGDYTLSNVDDNRFGTAYIRASIHGETILTVESKEYYSSTYSNLSEDTSYDFSTDKDLGGTGSEPSPEPSPTPVPDSLPQQLSEKKREEVEKTPEQKWAQSENNPENYAVSIKDSSGKEVRSGVPSRSECADNVKAIVPQKLEMAEKIFEKSKSENQIVITIKESQCGSELIKLLTAKAVEQGGTLGTIYEIKAEERAKKDYAFVRAIETVKGEGVTYTIELPKTIQEAVENKKMIDVIQYTGNGTTQLLTDLDAGSKTITFQTSQPSTTFAFVIKQQKD